MGEAYQLLLPSIMGKTAVYMREKYKRVPEAIHVHDLTRCSHKREMEERYPELAETVLFKPPVQIGEMIHTFIESLPTIDRAQQVFERRVNRHLVVGKPDITTEDAVYDLKFRERLYDRPLEHDVLRASMYAWLARKPYGHIIYINPREFREWVGSPVTTETVLYLIEHPKSPRWDWECRLCPFILYCPLRVVRRSRSGEELEYEWHSNSSSPEITVPEKLGEVQATLEGHGTALYGLESRLSDVEAMVGMLMPPPYERGRSASRWVLEMYAPDMPAWYRAFTELKRKPLTRREYDLVSGYERYLRRKTYLTLRQIDVLRRIAEKYEVELPPIPMSSPQVLDKVVLEQELGVIRPELLKRWRKFVPEPIIEKMIKHREWATHQRLKEQWYWVRIPNIEYLVPPLPIIKEKAEVYAGKMDCDGWLETRLRMGKDRVNGWKHEYIFPRINFTGTTYDLVEDYAKALTIGYIEPLKPRPPYERKVLYTVRAAMSRAVHATYLMEPYFIKWKPQAQEILTLYKETSTVPVG